MTGTLVIDTASDGYAIGWQREDGSILLQRADESRERSRGLLVAIGELAGDLLDDVSAIVVITGPGSYAGLRVGIATAQGLALARSVPVYGVGTMEAIAAADGSSELTTIHAIGRGEFALQRWEDGRARSEIEIATAAELSGQRLAGEGAGALGGRELTAEDRVRGALAVHNAALADGSASPGADPYYVREPHITRPRRTPLRKQETA